MSNHTQDGRVWAVQTTDGRKVRVHPSMLAAFPRHFKLAPSERAKAEGQEDTPKPKAPANPETTTDKKGA